MIYVDFRNEVTDRLKSRYSPKGWEIKLYLEGDTSKDKTELEFIHQTNIKYFGHYSDTLGGDFIRMAKRIGTGTSICRFEVKYLFDEFSKHDWEYVFTIAEENIRATDGTKRLIDSMDNYQEINNMLIAKPMNYEKNKEALHGHVFRQIGDFAIVLYMRVSENKDNLISFKVPLDDFNKWGISNDQAMERALENSSILYPPKMYCTIANLIQDQVLGIAYSPFNIEKDTLKPKSTLVCTSTEKLSGSAVLFYPGMQEKIFRALGNEDYYVAFTSTSEFHIHRCNEFDADKITPILRDSNKKFPDNFLSDLVYRYYGDKKELVPVGE